MASPLPLGQNQNIKAGAEIPGGRSHNGLRPDVDFARFLYGGANVVFTDEIHYRNSAGFRLWLWITRDRALAQRSSGAAAPGGKKTIHHFRRHAGNN
jgi:hypothetical protein